MEDKTPPMPHQPSNPESDHHQIIPPQPSKPKKMGQQRQNRSQYLERSVSDNDGSQYLEKTPTKKYSKKVGEEEIALNNATELGSGDEGDESGRERLKRHRVEVAGRVWIPDIWGQEELLKDWIDCSAFDAPLVSTTIVMARAALVEEGRRVTSPGLRIRNSSSFFIDLMFKLILRQSEKNINKSQN
ncbi:Protein BIC1, partial [Mucuna pruriens]